MSAPTPTPHITAAQDPPITTLPGPCLPDGPEQRERDEKLRRFQGESDVSYDWLWRGSPLNDPDDESVTYPFAR